MIRGNFTGPIELLVSVRAAIGVRAGGARGAAAPQILGNSVWAARENLGKASF